MTNEHLPTAATESEGAALHKAFCAFLLGVLQGKTTDADGTERSTCSPAWGAVIRAFLKDNSITAVPDTAGADPLSQLAHQFRNGSPPRLNPDLDLDTEDLH